MSGFVKAGQTFLKALMSGGKQKTTGTEVIKNFGIAKNIDTKRAIQDKVTKTVDSAFKKADLPPSVRSSIETKNKKAALKRDEGKKLKNISYKLDELEEKVKKRNKGSKKLFEAFKGRKFNKGGRVGLKRGTGLMKKKSNIQKIKETFSPKKSAAKKSTKFGMLSVKAGIDKNPNPTQADRIAGAKMKNKKRFV